ncbi:26S proteasome non-ATPase regulatory subunit 9 isoform X2 [Eucyclogobius newberryi]|uniref:26S proteasome non-ATPase regulatory subunit 9 isoform X2 n=1 Tax=Eucyclogobius newberryi TaxID=166745 RepID=UPI003B5A31CC
MRLTEEAAGERVDLTMDHVKTLIQKKDEMEEQIKAYYDVLEDGVGIEGPLVDAEGFPRADVNLYQIRTARHQIACLQNDHKAIMTEIEEALHKLHAQEKEKRGSGAAHDDPMEEEPSLPTAFARVDGVTAGSPAQTAGLRVGDEVIEFGSVNSNNFQNLQNIASVVQHSEGKTLRVVVVRSGERCPMTLIPQRWSGRGLLGCNIVPAPQ